MSANAGALALRFLGVGSAQAPELGSACVVLERDGKPLLMIDCGNEALSLYERHYAAWPRANVLTPKPENESLLHRRSATATARS